MKFLQNCNVLLAQSQVFGFHILFFNLRKILRLTYAFGWQGNFILNCKHAVYQFEIWQIIVFSDKYLLIVHMKTRNAYLKNMLKRNHKKMLLTLSRFLEDKVN